MRKYNPIYIIMYENGSTAVENANTMDELKDKLRALKVLYPKQKYVVYVKYNIEV